MSDIAIKVAEPISLRARLNEDWLAVVIGLLVFAASLFSVFGNDLMGWAVTTTPICRARWVRSPRATRGSAAAAR